jgi:hypothetical protein
VCTRGSNRAWSCGPSTSPLEAGSGGKHREQIGTAASFTSMLELPRLILMQSSSFNSLVCSVRRTASGAKGRAPTQILLS